MPASADFQTPRAKLHTLVGLLQAAWRGAPVATSLLYLFAALQGVGAAAEIWTLGRLIDALDRVVSIGAPIASAALWLSLMIGIRLAIAAINSGVGVLQVKVREAQEGVVSRVVLDKAGRLPYIRFETQEFHNSLTRAVQAINNHWFFDISWRFVSLVNSLFGLAGLVWVVGRGHWLVPIIILGTGFITMRIEARFGIIEYALQRGATDEIRWVYHLSTLLTSRETAKEVRLFGASSYLLGRWQKRHREIRMDLFRKNTGIRVRLALVGLAPIVAFGLSLWLVLMRLPSGDLTSGDIVSVLYAVINLQGRWEGFAGLLLNVWGFYLWAMGDLVEFLHLEEPSEAGHPLLKGAHTIEVQRVSFTYPGSSRPALRDVSLSIRPGEKVALVGENGSGKTTLVNLLFGLLPPTEGAVLYDGKDVRELDSRSLCQQATAVFQDYVQYQLTARENVGFGKVERLHDDALLRLASAKGGAADIVDELPQGFETLLGPTFGGRDLSSGQWQRIATARAFMRDDDAHLLILDEPTAALDPKAEVEIYRRFQEMAGDRTAILISHRMGFARLADRIVVLKEGELVESGIHDELLAAGGEYAKLFATQAKWYQ